MDRDTYGGECGGGTSPSPPNQGCDTRNPADAFAKEYDARFTERERLPERDRLRGGPSTLRNQVEHAHRLSGKQALYQEAARLRQEADALERLAMVLLDSMTVIAPEADAALWNLVNTRRR